VPETTLLECQFTETKEACEEPEKSLLQEGHGRFLQTLLALSTLRCYGWWAFKSQAIKGSFTANST